MEGQQDLLIDLRLKKKVGGQNFAKQINPLIDAKI